MKRFMFVPMLLAGMLTASAMKPKYLQIEVDGIVCNFCAYGIEKWISKLPFVDVSQHGGDGVLVDIDTSFVNVALLPGKKINFKDLKGAVDKAGYPAVRVKIVVKGSVAKKGGSFVLKEESNKQEYSVSGKDLASLTGKTVTLELSIAKNELEAYDGKKPVKAKVVSGAAR